MGSSPTAPSRERQRPGSATYLITFTCYGTRLHGQDGTIDRNHNEPGSRAMPENLLLLEQSRGLMAQPPYVLDEVRRRATIQGIRQVCDRRGWNLIAAHVRTNHVHVVVYADSSPENVMIALKAYASRAINELAIDPPEVRRWTRHGSTRYLWTHTEVRAAHGNTSLRVRANRWKYSAALHNPLAIARGSVPRNRICVAVLSHSAPV